MNINTLIEEQSEYYIATLVYNKLKHKYVYYKRKYHLKVGEEWKPLDSDYIEFRKDFRNEINNVKNQIKMISENYLKDLREMDPCSDKYWIYSKQINELSSISDKIKKNTTYNQIIANCKELFYVSEL